MLRGVVAVLFAAGLTGLSSGALARSGTHPLVVSTWDARASSVTLDYRHGFMDGGGFNDVAYTANFSATSGLVSAQFGLHYVNFAQRDLATAHGLAATATAVFHLPLTHRGDDGQPLLALDPFIGAAPTGLVSGSLNYVTIPLVLGLGMPITPVKFISLTPWFELSPAVNFDPEFKPYQLSAADAAKVIDPTTGRVKLTQAQVEDLLAKSTDLKTGVGAGFRGGLNLAIHLSPAVDLAGDFAVSSAGTAFSGPRVFYLGGGFVWRWDDIVPAVLPPNRRLLHEDCDAIEARFRMCPNAERWKAPPETNAPSTPSTPVAAPPAVSPSTTTPSGASTAPTAAPPPVAPPPPAPASTPSSTPNTPPPAPAAGTGTFPP
jgi:hypothetical protein